MLIEFFGMAIHFVVRDKTNIVFILAPIINWHIGTLAHWHISTSARQHIGTSAH